MGIAATDPGDSSDEKGNLPTKINTSSAPLRPRGENFWGMVLPVEILVEGTG